MARGYSWTKDYILDNLTLDQVVRLHQVLILQQRQETYQQLEAMTMAVAFGNGHLKQNDYREYADGLIDHLKPPPDVTKTLKSLKQEGFEIEEN